MSHHEAHWREIPTIPNLGLKSKRDRSKKGKHDLSSNPKIRLRREPASTTHHHAIPPETTKAAAVYKHSSRAEAERG